MCGLVGLAGKLEYKDEATMKRLLLLDFFRGEHSTGLAGVRNNGEVHISKMASHPLDLFEVPRFKTALSGYNSQLFLGHNRAATVGSISSANAHPFQFDHIIGAQNGTLDITSHAELEELAGERYPVDSQALFAAIARLGIEETVKHMRGAWALTWYDEREGSLNFLRNDKRPFWYAFAGTTTGEITLYDKIIWASEHPMMAAAVQLSQTGYKLFKTDDEKKSCFFQTDEDIWYKFDLEELRAGSTTRPKPQAKKLAAPVPKEVKSNTAPFPNTQTQLGGSGTNYGKTTSQSGSGGGKTVIELLGIKSEPYAGVISKERFEVLASCGCSWCSATVDWGDLGVTVIDADDVILCDGCSGSRNPDGNRVYLKEDEMRAFG